MRSDRTVSTIGLDLAQRDREICDAIKAATALDSDSNLMRAALYYFGTFVLGKAAIGTDDFRLVAPQRRSGQRGRAVPIIRPHD